jgi:hypothetical protein
LKKYGNEESLSSSVIREKIKKTVLDKYGVDNVLISPMIRLKITKTMLERYGCGSALQNKEILDRVRETNVIRYGFTNPFQNKNIRGKSTLTNLRKYGVAHAMQNSEIAERSSRHSIKYKDYHYPSGNTIRIQGYEDMAIDKLLECFHESEILTKRTDMPEVWYVDDNGQYHRYYPDIYIPSMNLIIEVKSVYTYAQNVRVYHKKRKACLYLGYEFESYIFKNRKDGRMFVHV